MSAAEATKLLEGLTLSDTHFVDLLRNLIGEVEHLQNNPPKYIPTEDKACGHVLDVLKPYSKENGGPLLIKHIHFKPNRGNLIIQYNTEDSNDKTPTLGFVGSHLDVVPANPETWERNPFELTVEGDMMYGRGTTDCLGHVALVTELFRQLAVNKPKLKLDVWAVFIASEENATIREVGVDMLEKTGELKHLKNGPVVWVDSADSQPCIGTAGAIRWDLTARGKLFHSGLPHKAINPLELAMEALQTVQRRFYEDFPPCEQERTYNFQAASSMKPTQWTVAEGSINQIPPHCTVSGDIRLTPFYKVADCVAAVESYVAELNANLEQIPTRGPNAKYTLPDEGLRGALEMKIDVEPFRGIACHLDSVGHKAILAATESVLKSCKPFSICGSLPLVRDMQDAGFDVQVVGYGRSSVYHGDNEYLFFPEMKNGFLILARVIAIVNQNAE